MHKHKESIRICLKPITKRIDSYVYQEKGELYVDLVIDIINQMGVEQIWNDNSPIWHRPQYTHVPMFMEKDFLQVVGHPPLHRIDKYCNVISCDVFSTYKDGNPIGSQEFLLLDTKTWQYEKIKKGFL